MSSSDEDDLDAGLSTNSWTRLSLEASDLTPCISFELLVRNLMTVFEGRFFTSAAKAIQLEIADAVASLSASPDMGDRTATLFESGLLPLARRDLSTKRMKAILSSWKATTVQRARRRRIGGHNAAEDAEDDQEEEAPTAIDLPVEVLSQVFELLDPASAARCASVCRLWRSVLDDGNASNPYLSHARYIWTSFCVRLLPPTPSTTDPSTLLAATPSIPHSRIFSKAVASAPALRAVLTEGGGYAPVFLSGRFVTAPLSAASPLYLLLPSQTAAILRQRCGFPSFAGQAMREVDGTVSSPPPPPPPPIPISAMWDVYRRIPRVFRQPPSAKNESVDVTVHRTITLVLTGNLYRASRKWNAVTARRLHGSDSDSATCSSDEFDGPVEAGDVEGGTFCGGGMRQRRAIRVAGGAEGEEATCSAMTASRLRSARLSAGSIPAAGPGPGILKFWDLGLR